MARGDSITPRRRQARWRPSPFTSYKHVIEQQERQRVLEDREQRRGQHMRPVPEDQIGDFLEKRLHARFAELREMRETFQASGGLWETKFFVGREDRFEFLNYFRPLIPSAVKAFEGPVGVEAKPIFNVKPRWRHWQGVDGALVLAMRKEAPNAGPKSACDSTWLAPENRSGTKQPLCSMLLLAKPDEEENHACTADQRLASCPPFPHDATRGHKSACCKHSVSSGRSSRLSSATTRPASAVLPPWLARTSLSRTSSTRSRPASAASSHARFAALSRPCSRACSRPSTAKSRHATPHHLPDSLTPGHPANEWLAAGVPRLAVGGRGPRLRPQSAGCVRVSLTQNPHEMSHETETETRALRGSGAGLLPSPEQLLCAGSRDKLCAAPKETETRSERASGPQSAVGLSIHRRSQLGDRRPRPQESGVRSMHQVRPQSAGVVNMAGVAIKGLSLNYAAQQLTGGDSMGQCSDAGAESAATAASLWGGHTRDPIRRQPTTVASTYWADRGAHSGQTWAKHELALASRVPPHASASTADCTIPPALSKASVSALELFLEQTPLPLSGAARPHSSYGASRS